MAQEKSAPAGSVIVDDAVTETAVVEATEADYSEQQIIDAANAAQQTDTDEKEDPSAAPAMVEEERYKNLERKMSEQGAEVGQLRQMATQLQEQNQALQEQAQNVQQQAQIATSADPAFEAKLASIQGNVDEGEISIAQGMAQMTTLARDQGRVEAAQQVDQAWQAKAKADSQAKIAGDFRSSNSDFDAVVQSGVLDAIKASDPIHDNVSAYYVFKAAEQAKAGEEAATQAYQKGLADQLKLDAGKNVAATTLAGPGTNAQQTTPKTPMNENDVESSMLNVLRGMRSGG